MPSALQRALYPALLCCLLAFAHAPLVRAGPSGEDFRVLVKSAGEAPWRRSAAELALVDGRGSLLGGLSLACSRQLFGAEDDRGDPFPGAFTVRAMRLENLALLLVAAVALAVLVRRLLLPWIGSDQARAAALAACALLVLHPLAVHAVAGLAFRGLLMAFALGTAGAALFLRGRQDRQPGIAMLAVPCCALAALAGDGALVLPLVLAMAEYVSAHRYRPARERLRTSSTTLLVALAVVVAALLVRGLATDVSPWSSLGAAFARFGERADALAAFELGAEKLGLLVLPSSMQSAGLAGLALAGLLFLVALHPALAAARSAPRLWGALSLAWLACVALALLSVAWIRVEPADLARAGELVGPAALMAVGLGLASTALSGARRLVLPGTLALGYAVLAHTNALPFETAARVAAGLQHDVEAVRVLHGQEAEILILDAPRRVTGLDALGSSIGWCLHPGGAAPATDAAARASALTLAAFLALAREREFVELRTRSFALVFPASAVDVADGWDLPSGTRHGVLVTGPRPSTGPRTWRGDSRSPDLDLEAWTTRALRVRAAPGTSTEHAQSVSWRAREPALREGTHPGAWLTGGAEPLVVFDLGASLAWCLGDRVQRVWFEGGLPAVTLAEVLDRLPPLSDGVRLEPMVDGDDWYFERPSGAILLEAGARGEYSLGLLDLTPGSWEYAELPVTAQDERLLVEGAAAHVARAVERARAAGQNGTVAWTLDYRVDGVAVARARGRRIGRRGASEEDA